jgi:hypothetical protein
VKIHVAIAKRILSFPETGEEVVVAAISGDITCAGCFNGVLLQ